MYLSLAFLALLTERIFGYPDWVYRLIGHPVTWIGKLISALDARWNREGDTPSHRRLWGIFALAVVLAVVVSLSLLLESLLLAVPFGFILVVLVAASLPAQRSLEQHVEAVAAAMEMGGLPAGRRSVSMIVGRDPENLDSPAVCRAAIESLAENFSDGIVAPAFWLGVGGLAGGVAYKAINTADSMIGHRTDRHEAFGWASARFDDLVNLPASRLSGVLFVVAACLVPGASPSRAIAAIRRDARYHRSPNAGWPEAAMAGALGVALAGPRSYGGHMIEVRFMGEGGRTNLDASDIRRALRVARVADALLIGIFGLAALAILRA
ncbi:Cobalamin biosynthetic protein (anaerobic pathway of cobalamin biosynthesis, cobD) [Pseudorhizobium banfieldiae]|uniref:Cobalamin biosynthesis protein CobD n=1 Tax=Pseudorhizobium banfieldiae TaxID=1125847 RepID=L0NKL0_9HYPH|nr:adenosylcobinamide-phosphate synthase CbiB [Pseudorhizobium banfieldiae]CAD6617680.1 cobalamin biosynthesis protein CobD [arsenite-oxidising bacterium NT-25]CCF20837.1 Cobalamin biosynthetic protein (anaerobic pathway of cobalamin biosynthesis, cobD) [Pseudorhizobium banfieldiae]